MSSTSTSKLIGLYYQQPEPSGFFMGLFNSPPQNFHSTEKVEIDIIRDDEDIAVPVLTQESGRRRVELTKYVNKDFPPVEIHYETTISAGDLARRAPGVDPYTDPDFASNATNATFRVTRHFERMIRRTIELIASQVMQTGTITQLDSASTTIYSCDFQPKDTTGTLVSGDNIVTTGTDWVAGGATGDPLGDLEGLASNVTSNGKLPPTDIAFGNTAWAYFMSYSAVLQKWNLLNANLGQLAPPVEQRGGGVYHGTITIGSRTYRLWTYDALYKSAAGTLTRYLTADKVVMWAEGGRRDLTFGKTAVLEAARDARALSYIPRSLNSSEARMGMDLGGYFLNDGTGLVVTVDSRPLCIPTAIDTFGCIDVVA